MTKPTAVTSGKKMTMVKPVSLGIVARFTAVAGGALKVPFRARQRRWPVSVLSVVAMWSVSRKSHCVAPRK
jgi:hypothetical protein